jgi:hypothetical protein
VSPLLIYPILSYESNFFVSIYSSYESIYSLLSKDILWKTKKSGETKLPFTEQYTNPENGKDPTKTGYSCHTKKDQSHPHSLSTGYSGKDRDERCWENE